MIKMVVFDMAGTAIDENNVVYKTLRSAIAAAGFKITLEEVLAEGAGKEKLQAIRDLLAKVGVRNEAMVLSIYNRFIADLSNAYETMDITAQPGAERLFSILKSKGIYTVLNTGYDQKTAESIMRKVGWKEGNQVDGLVTATQVEHNRPHPDMIHLAIQRFGLNSASEVAKIGDSAVDIEEGRNAGCRLSIGITTGAQSREQMSVAGPDYIIDSLLDLVAILETVPV